ncbi:hypothetical protein COL87_01635 [Bacillus pseudomycoides]|nr:hypothetical protein CN641_28010 [Bacillus pseudomycoides]PEJ27393.1 hypothetical protein CN677_27855 [Bacillus pseudomycoides]PGA75791.1 hypothetical protein COL87_01635 [Bacillus pseudomycoides]PGE96533.1 hypothetical protein COM62_13755 [Bacillus pseudomycoides]PHA82051.1 hypothetical protein COE78_24510 [Bacillus pseudomycoides]
MFFYRNANASLLGVTIHTHQLKKLIVPQNEKNKLNSHGYLWKEEIFGTIRVSNKFLNMDISTIASYNIQIQQLM